LNISNTNLIKFLQDHKKFNADHLEKIAEILFELGSVVNNDIKINVLEKSLTIYDYLNHKSLTYSHDRIMKVEKIRTILKN
jgi:flagellin-specific chaperone FliS